MMLKHMIFSPLLSRFFLKNLEISTTSFGNFAGIRGERAEMDASLFVFLPFLGVMSLFICGLNWALTLHLKEKLFLSAMRWSQWDLKKAEINLQAASPIPSRFLMLLALSPSIDLLRMYF